MFTLRVRLRAKGQIYNSYSNYRRPLYTGLKALDFRRAHGMTEGVEVPPPDATWEGDAHGTSIPVDEAFARLHFGPSETVRTVFADVEDLLPGEACIVGIGGAPMPEDGKQRASLGLTPGMSADRALTLGALAALRDSADELRKEADEAKEKAKYLRREVEDYRQEAENLRQEAENLRREVERAHAEAPAESPFE